MKLAYVVLAIAAIMVTGCLGVSKNAGPLSATVMSFRTLEDAYHNEWVLQFRNQGDAPITHLKGWPTGELYDGTAFDVDGINYTPHAHAYGATKNPGVTPFLPRTLVDGDVFTYNLFPPQLTLPPGGTTNVTLVLYFDHLNITFLNGAGHDNTTSTYQNRSAQRTEQPFKRPGWLSLEDEGRGINATDFFAVEIATNYFDGRTQWTNGFVLPCFDREGERIEIKNSGQTIFCDQVVPTTEGRPSWTPYAS